MLPPEVILTFMAAATLLAWVPGPDNIFVLTQSALQGPVAGLAVTLGLCIGLMGHTLAVSLGVAAIFQSSPLAFSALKFVGAAYLLHLAWRAFRARPEPLGAEGSAGGRLRGMVGRGIVMNLTNPKVAIFFLAFLPQFTAPERGSLVGQMLQLGGLFILCAFVSFALISWLAGALSRWLRASPGGQVILNRAAGFVFVVLAVKLAMAQQ